MCDHSAAEAAVIRNGSLEFLGHHVKFHLFPNEAAVCVPTPFNNLQQALGDAVAAAAHLPVAT